MAPSFRGRKNLVCFYCNKKSSKSYNGYMTKWDCAQCEATNFLDQNGDITDPPVATQHAASNTTQYAIPRSHSPPHSQDSNALFCTRCLKNQHLFTASLAQYDVELDTRDPSYRQKEKEYYAYRWKLEKTYPQVCEECEPKVLARMKEAGMTAKADHLRRIVQRTRDRRTQRVSVLSPSNLIELAGKYLWHLGLFGQLSWSIAILLTAASYTHPKYSEMLPLSAAIWLDSLAAPSTSSSWARYSLYASILSFWWNPKFRQMNKGFINHINGFGAWYKLQTLLIMSRSLFYCISGTGVLSDPVSSASIGGHIVMFLYILFLSTKAKMSLKVDMTPLWQNTPEKLTNVGPRLNLGPQASDSLADILDSIAATPRTSHIQELSPTPSSRRDNQRPAAFDSPENTPPRNNYQRDTITFTGRVNTPSFELSRRYNPQQSSMTSYSPSSPSQNNYGAEDEMDWSPANAPPPPQSKHRAFQPVASAERNNQRFGHSPVGNESSPFWFKVPPAPITPAHRLRNPPNKPSFRAPSQEVKENFFNNVTRKESDEFLNGHNQKSRHEMELKQPTFFPPEPTNEAGNALADLLTTFSLGASDSETPIAVEKQFQWDHFGQAVVLALGIFFWNHTMSNPGEHAMKVMLAVMTACFAIGTHTIINQALLEPRKKGNFSKGVGIAFGALECVSAIYGAVEILAGRGDCTNCASLGTILLGGMLVQEFWYASFG